MSQSKKSKTDSRPALDPAVGSPGSGECFVTLASPLIYGGSGSAQGLHGSNTNTGTGGGSGSAGGIRYGNFTASAFCTGSGGGQSR